MNNMHFEDRDNSMVSWSQVTSGYRFDYQPHFQFSGESIFCPGTQAAFGRCSTNTIEIENKSKGDCRGKTQSRAP